MPPSELPQALAAREQPSKRAELKTTVLRFVI
jgi:hypothetical protein